MNLVKIILKILISILIVTMSNTVYGNDCTNFSEFSMEVGKEGQNIDNVTERGYALTIGLNAIDPNHYANFSGELQGCEADAAAMREIGISEGFRVRTLMTRDATRKNVLNEISKAAEELKAGDIFLLSYSGHGGQLPDYHEDELDERDETWCLYDGMLVDDELYSYLKKFAKGVRILMFTDCCFSGTCSKAIDSYGRITSKEEPVHYSQKVIPREYTSEIYRKNKAFYDKILNDPSLTKANYGSSEGDDINASVLQISSCQDNQFATDGIPNGLFTSKLLSVWNGGAFKGNYREFHRELVRQMPREQTPQYEAKGIRDSMFESQQIPFTISSKYRALNKSNTTIECYWSEKTLAPLIILPSQSKQLGNYISDHDEGVGKLVAEGNEEFEKKHYGYAIKKYDEAISQINDRDDLACVYYNKGNALCGLEEYDEAVKLYDLAININSNFADAWYNKGFALEKSGQRKEADEAYAKAKDLGYTGEPY
jgi:tetratricopeptide (TPR) repeat protein